jgi:hypothetical protein
MKRKRHTPEQIIRKLRTAELLLNQGQTVADVCRALEVLTWTPQPTPPPRRSGYRAWWYQGRDAGVALVLPLLDRAEHKRAIQHFHIDASVGRAALTAALEAGCQAMSQRQTRLPVIKQTVSLSDSRATNQARSSR